MGYVKKARRDDTEEEEGMERVIEICVCVPSVAVCLLKASGEMSYPDVCPALSAEVVKIL